MPPTLAPSTDLPAAQATRGGAPKASLRRLPLPPTAWPRAMGGPLTLAALGAGFFSLPWVAWTLTGEWVPEMLAFGVGAIVVGVVANNR